MLFRSRPVKGYEYAVRVTDLSHELHMIAQLYRDRGDAENTFDGPRPPREINLGLDRVYDSRSEALSMECDGGGVSLQPVACIRAPGASQG